MLTARILRLFVVPQTILFRKAVIVSMAFHAWIDLNLLDLFSDATHTPGNAIKGRSSMSSLRLDTESKLFVYIFEENQQFVYIL